jgi:predicted amidohydrolase YtcJ
MLDTVLYNGKIETLDNENHIFSMIGIEDGKIKMLSADEDIESVEAKEKIDLNGKLVLPGFVDTHLHMINYAFVEKSVKLFDCRSVEEMLESEVICCNEYAHARHIRIGMSGKEALACMLAESSFH